MIPLPHFIKITEDTSIKHGSDSSQKKKKTRPNLPHDISSLPLSTNTPKKKLAVYEDKVKAKEKKSQ